MINRLYLFKKKKRSDSVSVQCLLGHRTLSWLPNLRGLLSYLQNQSTVLSSMLCRRAPRTEHSGAQQPTAVSMGRTGVGGGNTMCAASCGGGRYKPISFKVCKFSSLKISFPVVPVLLKTAIGRRSVVWRSQPVGFLLGTISAGGRRLLEELQSHERQPSEWTDYKMAPSLFHFIASYYFRFWRSETHYGPCNFLKIQKQMKTQIPFQSHNQLLLETIQLATFLTCISDSTTFSRTQTEPSNGDFTDLSQSQQMGNFNITRTNLLLGRILPHRTRSMPFGP